MQELTKREKDVLKVIRDNLVHLGKSPTTRMLMDQLNFKSPRSISVYIKNLIKKGCIKRKEDLTLQLMNNAESEISDKNCAKTVKIPLVGLTSCGAPITAEENVSAEISVSTDIARQPYKYFLLKVKGDSMDQKEIYDGDIVLVRQQSTANDGDVVVALIDDEATIKEFHRMDQGIVLKPRSSNEKHKPIILTRDFRIQGIFISKIPDFGR